MFHILYTEKTDNAKIIFSKVYDSIAKMHENDQASIFHTFHTKFDAILTKNIVDAKFPGLSHKFIDFLENIFRKRFITIIQDKITRNEILGQSLATIRRILQIFSSSLDFLKDIALAATITYISGGPRALLEAPRSFVTVVVMCQVTTILVPVVLSTLHLAINHPNTIFSLKKNPPRWIMRIACLLFSVFNQILLIVSFEKARENARRKAKKNHKAQNLSQLFEKSRAVKSTYVEHKSIELGREDIFYQININS